MLIRLLNNLLRNKNIKKEITPKIADIDLDEKILDNSKQFSSWG